MESLTESMHECALEEPVDVLAFTVRFFHTLGVAEDDRSITNYSYEDCVHIVRKYRGEFKLFCEGKDVGRGAMLSFLKRIEPGYLMVLFEKFDNPCAKFIHDHIFSNPRLKTADNLDIWIPDEDSRHLYPFYFDCNDTVRDNIYQIIKTTGFSLLDNGVFKSNDEAIKYLDERQKILLPHQQEHVDMTEAVIKELTDTSTTD